MADRRRTAQRRVLAGVKADPEKFKGTRTEVHAAVAKAEINGDIERDMKRRSQPHRPQDRVRNK